MCVGRREVVYNITPLPLEGSPHSIGHHLETLKDTWQNKIILSASVEDSATTASDIRSHINNFRSVRFCKFGRYRFQH